MQDWLLPAALVVAVLLALLVLLLVVLVLRFRRRVSGQLDAARREAAELREQVAGLAAPAPAGEHQGRDRREQETAEYVITDMPGAPTDSTDSSDSTGDGAPPGRIEGRLFADIVLRESLLKAAAATHGVRRALAPETRNRIRFEMRREVKRSRKERRADLRAARRLLQRRAGEQEVVGPADEDAA